MSFEDNMIEYGFTDGDDYLDYLITEDECRRERMEEYNYYSQEHEQWQGNLYEEFDKSQHDEYKDRCQYKKIKDGLEKENILKLWAEDHPLEARMWYAYSTHSPELENYHYKHFFDQLGSLHNRNSNNVWTGYNEWKCWIEKNEAYKEFKDKAPKEYEYLKNIKYKKYIKETVQKYFRCPINDSKWRDNMLVYGYGKKGVIKRAQKILNKWINTHSELWKEITSKYKSETKTDSEYLYQAWLSTFIWDDAFAVWKFQNPSLWNQFRKKCDDNNIADTDKLLSVWMETHKEVWDKWKLSQSELWNHLYTYHKTYLWYIYTEVQWANSGNKEEDLDDLIRELGIEAEHNSIDDFTINDIDDDPVFNDKMFCDSLDDWEESNLDKPKFEYLDPNDPRFKYKCKTNMDEDNIHDIIITKYEKELLNNSDKSLFIHQNCSEQGFDTFLNRARKDFHYGQFTPSSIKIEESPEQFANRKILELWINKHKGQWRKWKYRYYWVKDYNKVLYSFDENYKVWKQLKANIWKRWINRYYEQWKQSAQNIDMWFAWLIDNNEWTFHEWASSHLKRWTSTIEETMDYDYNMAYQSLFCHPYTDFKKWRQDNPKEWKYWEKYIKERILIDEFERGNIERPYNQSYKLRMQIMEKLYLQKITKDVFYEHLAIIEDDEKYGFINENGVIVIEPQYDYACNFKHGFAAITIEEDIYDEYVPEIDEYIGIKYGGKWGLINSTGEYVLSPKYDKLVVAKGGFIIFSIGGKLDTVNHRVVGSKWGLMNNNMEIIIAEKYSSLALLGNGLVRAGITDESGTKYGLLTTNGQEITTFKYSYIYDSSSKFMIANTNSKLEENNDRAFDYHYGKWGYLNTMGSEMASFIDAYDMSEFLQINGLIG
mgnify:CR=1 FL=1